MILFHILSLMQRFPKGGANPAVGATGWLEGSRDILGKLPFSSEFIIILICNTRESHKWK
jgi:hypothetical protein